MKKILFSALALMLTVSLLTSCASTRRIERIDAHHALEREKSMDASTINLWPLLVSGKGYTSVLWPMMDFDKHGFAIRPFINKEKDDWSILFPLLAWSDHGADGWCGLGYWNVPEEYCGLFPLFHYNADPDEFNYMTPLCYWGDGSMLLLPLVWVDEYGFLTIPYSHRSANKENYWWNYDLLPRNLEWQGVKSWNFHDVLMLAYFNKMQVSVRDRKSPDFREEYYLAEDNWRLRQDLYLQATGKKWKKGDDPPEREQKKYIEKMLAPATRTEPLYYYGFVPLFHASTAFGSTEWNALFYLLASGRTTPGKSYFCAPPLLTYRSNYYGKSEYPAADWHSRKFFMPLFYSKSEKDYARTDELAYRFGDVTPELLKERLYLTDPAHIKEWEEDFEHKVNEKEPTRIKRNTSRELHRIKLDELAKKHNWTKYPVPKNAEDVRNALAILADVKNYDVYAEQGAGVFPLYTRTTETLGDYTKTSSDALFRLYMRQSDSEGKNCLALGYYILAYFLNDKYGHDWHIPLLWRDYSEKYCPENNNYYRDNYQKRYLLWYYGKGKSGYDKENDNVHTYHGMLPLYHYSEFGNNESLLFFPSLLSWRYARNRSDGGENSCSGLLLGLLYYGEKANRKNPLERSGDGSYPGSIRESAVNLLMLEKDPEHHAYEYDYDKFLMMAKDTDAKMLFWKKDTPENVIRLYDELDSYWLESKLPEIRKLMAELKLESAGDPADEKVRLKLQQQLAQQYAESREFTATSFLGKPGFCRTTCGDESAFWLGGGLLAKDIKLTGRSETSILWYLYRSTVTPESTTRLFFPFIKTYSSKDKSSFSFLWRFLNIEVTEDGISGHILFIPF